MELSVRSKFMSEEVLEKRRQMIENEKLHINDKITKEVFQRLYSKYGGNLIEKDFACFFLDINEASYDKLKKGKTLEAVILIYEYISNEEFQTMRENVIKSYNLKHKDRITYDQLRDIYDQFGGRLSMQLFVEEILGMAVSDISVLRTGKIKDKPVNFEVKAGEYNAFHKKTKKVSMYVLNPEYIYEIRKRLVLEAGLRIGDNISYAQIQELNMQYCPETPEVLFAQKVIDMSIIQYNTLKRINSENPINGLVFQNADIPSKYIDSIQSEMIRRYKLESGQLLRYEEFEKLYEEYGGTLSRKSFAILVLDMSDESYSHFKSKIYKSVSILSSRKGTDFDIIRGIIIEENGLHCMDKLQYEQFKKLHQRYAPNTSEFIFAEKIFGISNAAFQAMKYRGTYACIHLRLPTIEEMKEIQKKVILETGMHINDKLNYAELERLHKLYGGILPIKIFATKVLCLDEQSFYRIKNNKGKEAFALFDLEISESEIERIKKKIVLEHDLQNPRKLSLEEIDNLYNTYGGIMPLLMFSREVLGISGGSLSNLRGKKYETTMACARSKFSTEEVKELKRYLAEEMSAIDIASQMGVTITFLQINIRNLIKLGELKESHMLYEKVKRLKEQERSPEEIVEELGISEEEIREMLARYKKEKAQEIQRKREEKREKRKNVEEQKTREKIKKKAERVLEEYEFDDKSIKEVRAYIIECKKSFEKGEFSGEDLNFLKECMIFVQCNYEEIELFCRICVKLNVYKTAIYFIMENIDNEGILPEERTKLIHLRENIVYAIRKRTAINMLQEGIKDTMSIAQRVGLPEVEVVGLKRKLQESKILLVAGSNVERGEEGLEIG